MEIQVKAHYVNSIDEIEKFNIKVTEYNKYLIKGALIEQKNKIVRILKK